MSLTTTAADAPSDQLSSLSPSPQALPTSVVGVSSFLPSVPSLDDTLNLITIYLISILLLFSLLSLFLIFHLRFRSRHRHARLHSFAFHSSLRLLLVSLVSLWSLVELLRLPHLRLHLLPPLSVPFQTTFCKLHIILSLGFFEPGFLVSLLALLNTSLHIPHHIFDHSYNNPPNYFLHTLGFVFFFCSPLCIALYLATFHLHTQIPLPGVFYHSVAFFDGGTGCKVVLCTYPLLSAVLFGVFSVVYAVALLFKSWKVISMAINKRLAARINVLSFTVLMCLAVQVVLMSLSVFLTPMGDMYYFLVFLIFVSVLVCAAVGEGILVIMPLIEALSMSTTIVAAKNVDQEESIGC